MRGKKKKSLSKNGFTEGYRNKEKREKGEIDRERNLTPFLFALNIYIDLLEEKKKVQMLKAPNTSSIAA